MAKLYMGFDAGTQSVKVAVYDGNFNPVASHSLPTTLHYPQPGWVQMNIDEFLNITVECMKKTVEAIKGKGYSPSDIAAVMGDGIICGICGVDENGKAVTPYINYLDSRTQADVDAINAKNLDIWGRETGNPEANCMFPAMFARWFLANSEDFRKKGVKFVHNAPYILMNLAGLKGKDAFIDWGAMSGWGLGYKVEKKEWSDEQLDILGIDKKYMPRILKPWDIVGGVSEEMAARTGLVAGTPVCAGAGDTMQSMLGSGVFEAGQGVDVAGTCAMFCVSTNNVMEPFFTWVLLKCGGFFVVRQIHHITMWAFILFTIAHIYLVFYHDYIERNGIASSIIGGWKFVREDLAEEYETEQKQQQQLQKQKDGIANETTEK